MTAAVAIDAWKLQAERMDATAREIFATMLGCECVPAQTQPPREPEMTARIVFSGALQGVCGVLCARADAATLARLFLGGTVGDAMIPDAIAELCNMLAGGWKRRLRPPASGAGMSAPAILAAPDPGLHSGLYRTYAFEGGRFTVQLNIDLILED